MEESILGACEDECYREYEQCIQDCKRPAPWYLDYLPEDAYRAVCYGKCSLALAACYAGCAAKKVAKFVTDIAEEAARFVAEHPGLVAGTIVIIAGVVLVATTGPGGAIVLVAA